MRLLVAAVTAYWALSGSLAWGEQEFPYKAFINADEVYVRSGPGQSYYPTDKLRQGQEVDVYRHDPGGWYAVRPPEDSFTWISARYLKPGVDNLAVVTDDRVAARVGSKFSKIRDIIQVRLHKGEVVEVLEKVETGPEGDRKVWYKIAPPSGEFRWIAGKYVDADYQKAGVRHPEEPAELPIEEEKEAAAVAKTEDPAQSDWDYEPQYPRQMTPEQYREKLQKLDVELSSMVIEEPTVWAFGELRLRTEELMDQAETALERGKARVLMGKMARFEDIKRRHDRINTVRVQRERTNRQFATLGRRDTQLGRRRRSEDRFDGVGELTRVLSPDTGSPRYALVDESGGVRCYVTASPGVSLQHYVGRRVGINGTRGYMPEQRTNHVMARHVSELNTRRLR